MQATQSKDGTTLAYDVYGTGPTLVYITGASCFRSFFPIVQDAKAFAKEFTVSTTGVAGTTAATPCPGRWNGKWKTLKR